MSDNKGLGINIYGVLKIDEKDINAQLKSISDLLKTNGQGLVIPVTIDDSKIKNLQSLINQVAPTKPIDIVNTESIRQADNEVQQLSRHTKEFIDSIKSIPKNETSVSTAVSKFTGFGDVSTTQFKNAQDQVNSFIVTVKNADGVLEKFYYKLNNSGTSFNLKNITESDAAVKRLLESQAKWNNNLEATKIKYNAIAESLETLWKSSDGKNTPLLNTEHVESLTQQYGMLLGKIKELDTANQLNIAERKAAIEAEITTIKALVKEYTAAEHVATNLRGVDPTNPEVFKKFESEFNTLQTKIQASGKGIFSVLASDVNDLKASLDTFSTSPSKTTMQEFLDKMAEVKAKFAAEGTIANSFDKISKEALKLSNSLNSLAGQDIFRKYATNPDVEEFRKRIAEIVSDLDKLKQNVTGATNAPAEERFKYLVQYTEELERLSQEYAKATSKAITFKSTLRDDKAIVSNRKSIQQLTAQITEYMTANTKAAKKYSGEFQNILNGLKMPNIAENTQQIQALSTEFDALRTKINLAGDAGATLGQRLTTAIRGIPIVGMYLSLNSLAMRAVRNIREMINSVIELNTQMVALKRVTNETSAGYDTFLKNATQQAIKLHTTITDLVEQTTTWVKLGNDLDTASKLAEISMMYSKVGDVDNATAVKDLVSTMKAFNIEAEDSVRIVDMLDKLNNEFAVTAADLGSGLRVTASSLQVAGNSLEQTLAMLTGGSEITQNTQEFANALRVMSMRIRSMKGELQDLGEEYENIQSLSKIQTQILNYTGVNIFKDDGSFKETYQIMKEISEVYFELEDKAKADLTEILFGKLRANQGVALLQAFQTGQVQKAYDAATKSAGTATTEFEKWSDSLEAHINSYKAAVQGLANTAVEDEGLKSLIDTGTEFVGVITKIVDRFGALNVLLPVTVGLLSGVKNIGVFTTMTDSITGATNQLALFGKTFNAIKADWRNSQGVFGKLGSIFSRPIISNADLTNLRNYGLMLGDNVIKQEAFSNAFAGSSSSVQILSRQILEQKALLEANAISQETYTARVRQLTTATQGATGATQAFGVALRALANVGIMIVINLLIQAFTELVQAEQKAIEANKETADKAEAERQAIENLYNIYLEVNEAVKDGTKDKWDLQDATKDLINELGLENDKLIELIDTYGDYEKAIKAAYAQKLLDETLPQRKEVEDYQKKVQSTAFDWAKAFGNPNSAAKSDIYIPMGGGIQALPDEMALKSWFEKWNEENGNPFRVYMANIFGDLGYTSTAYKNGVLNATTDEVKEEIETLTKLLDDLKNAGLNDTEFKTIVEERRNALQDAYSEYEKPLKEYNQKVANYVLIQQELLNDELPETYEKYVEWRKKLLDSATKDNAEYFEGDANDIEKAISSVLLSDADYKKFETRVKNINYLKDEFFKEKNLDRNSTFPTIQHQVYNYEKELDRLFNDLTDDELEAAQKIPHLFSDGLGAVSEKVKEFKDNPENQIEPEDILPTKEEFEAEYNKRKHWLEMGADDTGKAYDNSDFYAWLKDRDTGYKKYFEGIEEYQSEYWKYEEEVFKYEKQQSEELLKTASTLISKSKALTSAFKEQAENGSLSAETALTIAENGYAAALMYDKETGAITLNTEAYKKLALAELEAAEAQLQTELTQAQQDALNAQRNIVSNLGKTYLDAAGNVITFNQALALVNNNNDLVEALESRLEAIQKQKDSLDDIISGSSTDTGKADDIAKQNFDNAMKQITHLHNMGLASEKEYYNALEKANEDYYKNVADHESDYLSNIEKIYTGRQKLYKEEADKELTILDNKLKLGYIKQEDYDKSLVALAEKYYGKGTAYAGTQFAADEYKTLFDKSTDNDQSQYKEAFEKRLKELDTQLEKGKITVQEYRSEYGKLREEWWGTDSKWSGTTFADEMYTDMTEKLSDVDNLYKEKLDSLKKANDGSLVEQESYLNNWLALIKKFYETANPAKFKEEYADYADAYVKNLKDMLDKELITREEYIDKVVGLFNNAESKIAGIGEDTLSEWLDIDDYDKLLEELQAENDKTLESEEEFVRKWKTLNEMLFEGTDNAKYKANIKEITDYQLDLIKKQYDDGLISAKEYYEKVEKLLSETDTLGKDYISEKLKDAWDIRVENEKDYWTTQKELMESYYDKQIEALEKVSDEQEKITKQQELQLKLIEAQKKLEEAKKNRSQLVFVNGGFEYQADQDAILSAEDDVADALKDISENQLSEQVQLLKDQKEQQSKYYDALLKEIEYYINKTVPLSDSDSEVLSKIRGSAYAQYARDTENGEIIPDDISGLVPYNESTNDELSAVSTELELPNSVENMMMTAAKVLGSSDFINLVKRFGGNPTEQSVSDFLTSEKVLTNSFAQKTGNEFDSSASAANTAVDYITKATNFGDIVVNLSMNVENISDRMDEKIKEFCDSLGKAVKTEITRVIANA